MLHLVGAPISPENENTLYKWAHSESGGNPLRWNNPLNTTQNWPGASAANYAGVKRYPDLQTGALATAQTLTNGYYPDILSMLQNSVPTSQWSSAARAQVTKWGTNLAFLGGAGGSQSRGGGGVLKPTASSPTTGNSSLDLNPFDAVGAALSAAISGAGSSIGGGIGGAITGAEQSFARQALAVVEILVGVSLVGVAFLILALMLVKAGAPAAERVISTAALATPQGRVAKAAGMLASTGHKKPPAPAKSAAPPVAGKRPITAGGREIQVTNPQSRARLQAAGVEA